MELHNKITLHNKYINDTGMSPNHFYLRTNWDYDNINPYLEYANSVPSYLGDIKEIEKVQKRATKLIINIYKM